jgi:hypothetical protein
MQLHRRNVLKVAASAGTSALALDALAATASAAPACCAARADELWFINTRGVACGALNASSTDHWTAHRAMPGGPWQRASVADLWAQSGDGRVNAFYVHGNRINTQWAMRNGTTAYQALVRPLPTAPPPIRFIIWSWPSDRIGRPLRDARYKAEVADGECFKLGWFLGQMQPTSQVGLVGFSYGARIITGASHLLAGGQLFGRVVGRVHQPALRSVLWAAALHDYWLNPGQLHGRALYANQGMLNLYNPCDRVLRRYAALDRSARAQSLGFTGVPAGWLGAGAQRFAQRNVCCHVGNRHDMEPYCYSPTVLAHTRQYVYGGAV